MQRCCRLFQERPATAFELAGLAVPADPAYRMHAEEVKQTAFRLDGVLLPDAGRPDLPVVFTESQFYHPSGDPDHAAPTRDRS